MHTFRYEAVHVLTDLHECIWMQLPLIVSMYVYMYIAKKNVCIHIVKDFCTYVGIKLSKRCPFFCVSRYVFADTYILYVHM